MCARARLGLCYNAIELVIMGKNSINTHTNKHNLAFKKAKYGFQFLFVFVLGLVLTEKSRSVWYIRVQETVWKDNRFLFLSGSHYV